MSHDGDEKKGKLGFILLILHLIGVIGVITFLYSKYKVDLPTGATYALLLA